MEILSFKPTSVRENGLIVINDSSIPFPDNFTPKVRSMVCFPPGSVGGNHKHPRTEIFYSTGDLTFIYLDSNDTKHEESMSPDGNTYKLFVVTKYLPHAVVNKTGGTIFLIEFADSDQYDVEPLNLI